MTTPRSIRERSVFVDTSALYALADRADRVHEEAQRRFDRIAQERRPLVTSNLIVAETYALMRRALGHAAATRWLEHVDVDVVFQTPTEHERARDLLARYADKAFSYTDAVSFVLMERLEIPVAFTFDADFQQYGLEVYT